MLSINLSIKRSVLFVRLKGELDQSNSVELRNKLSDLINKYDIRNLVLNLRDLMFMDSSGIGVIIGRYNQLKARNGGIILCNLNANIERIINLSGLNRIVTIRDTEESAFYFTGV